jgi:hypothetical protein
MVESIMSIVSSVGIGQNENWSFVDRDIGSPTVQNTIVKN